MSYAKYPIRLAVHRRSISMMYKVASLLSCGFAGRSCIIIGRSTLCCLRRRASPDDPDASSASPSLCIAPPAPATAAPLGAEELLDGWSIPRPPALFAGLTSLTGVSSGLLVVLEDAPGAAPAAGADAGTCVGAFETEGVAEDGAGITGDGAAVAAAGAAAVVVVVDIDATAGGDGDAAGVSAASVAAADAGAGALNTIFASTGGTAASPAEPRSAPPSDSAGK